MVCTNALIDRNLQQQHEQEVAKWKTILRPIIDVILFFSAQSLALRGAVGQLSHSRSGNFLALVSLLAMYDPVFHSHLNKKERVNDFVVKMLSFLENLGLNIVYGRGQSYDGASVMKGYSSGVQACIKEQYQLAIYVHCAPHTLNLVIADSSKVDPGILSFFGVVQKLCTFFSSSNCRWEMLIIASDCALASKQVNEYDPPEDMLIIVSLLERFERPREVANLFSFMYASRLMKLSNSNLQKSCEQMPRHYEQDLDSGLYSELLSLRNILTDNKFSPSSKPINFAQIIVIEDLQEAFTDILTVYKLLLTNAVSIATCERSFSKLKIVKNYCDPLLPKNGYLDWRYFN
ncbi:hypothetical protein PR048_023441 [Dryococelus australis]|uniref:Zinc finger MYM-type protein 1-like n=1 Tax=Dryococelus australis TaxID=614101 RepID=A0ABQ9GU30_9NEOP|nr:hypothetical protein PR048_023441 [Dryococelus australis]